MMHTHSTPRGGGAAAAAVVISAAALLPAALTVPAARAQQPETTAPATAGAIKRAVTLAPVRPGGGSYAYWTVSKGGTAGGVSSLTPDQKEASVLLEPDTREIHVLDEANGTLAVFPVDAAAPPAAPIAIRQEDFTRVRLLVAEVTAGGKPVRSAVVTLTDADGKRAQRVLTPENTGRAEFGNVRIGRATLAAAYGSGTGGVKTSREVTVAPGTAGKPMTVPLTLTGGAVPTVGDTDGSPGTTRDPSPAPPAAAPPDPPPPLQAARDGGAAASSAPVRGPDWVSGLIGIGVLAGLGYFGLRAARARGITVPGALRGLGVELPQDGPAAATGGLRPAPGPPPPPPLPSLADLPPVTETPPPPGGGFAVAAAAAPRPATANPTIAGPRLVGIAGGVVGDVFPLDADGAPLSIGRDAAANALALTADATVSRQHARIEPQGAGFAIVDQGSHNGTFVNGRRVAGQVLQAGDEIQIGAARFRYEG